MVLHASAVTVDFTIDDFSDTFNADFIAAELQAEFSVTQALITPITEGTVSTQSCTAGTYAQTGTGQCVACAAGKYSTDLNANSESVCLQCGAGTYSTTVGATTGQTCQVCLVGTYNPSYGSNSSDNCLPCPANASSIVGSTHIQACVCNPGFSGMNGDTCTGCNTTSWCLNGQLNPCPPHSLSRLLSYDVRQCLCKPGYFGDTGLGAVDTSLYPLLCQFCKEDHFCPGGAVNVSYVCPDGKYSLPGSDETADCNCPEFASSLRNSQNSSQCICGAGYRKVYKANSPIGGWVCELCGPNDYCYSDQAFTCPSHSSSYTGSDALLDCFCDSGFQNASTQNTSQLCDNCDANYYCTGKGSKQQCTPHAVSPTQSPDATKCYCDWGYKGLNNSACVACASPKYCYGGIEATCVEDSASVPLAWSLLNCSCNPGRWGPMGGPCLKCGAGKYKLIQGCSACSASSDSDCLACDSGAFSSIIGRAQVCEGCLAGTFALTGATVCGACAAGTFSWARASVCYGCGLGQYAPIGATSCESCGPGKYLNIPGQASSSDCRLCPSGSFTLLNGTNTSSCFACPVGSASEGVRQLVTTADIPSVSGQLAATGISVSNDFSIGFTLAGLSAPNAQGDYQDILLLASEDQIQTYAEILYDSAGLLVSVGRACQLVLPLNASTTTWSVIVSISGGTMFGWVNGEHVTTTMTCTVLTTNMLLSTTAGITIGGMAPPSAGTVSLVTLTTSIGMSGCSQCRANTYAEERFGVCFPCPSHSTSGAGSGMVDCICNANYERKNTTVLYAGAPTFWCSPCDKGSTSMRGGTCQTCSSGSYQVGLDCEECGAGTFASNGATYCDICGSGTYSARRSGSCTPCAAGKYNPDNGSMACISCDAGYYSLSGAGNCSACDSGFISLGGSSSCFACPSGEYAASGAFQCSRCIPGTWSNSSIGSVLDCTSCGFGKYSTNLGANTSGVCKLCDPGTYSPENIAPDVSSCATCAAGLFAKAGSSACEVCQNGTYSLQSAGECQGCARGTYSSSYSSVCSLCQPGTFSEVFNGTSDQVCQNCENGTYSNRTGASSHLACSWCAAGEYAHAGVTSCSICENETYSGTHAGSCLGCPDFSDALPGSPLSGCICRAGFRYNRSQPVFSCDSCPPGAWSARNSEQCNLCPVGKASPTPRATEVATCTTCSGGMFTSTPGSSACLSCPPGTFSQDGASTCSNCSLGSWATARSPNCTQCNAGLYSTTLLAGSDASCIGCASGKFSATAGATSESTCQTCPVGSRSGMGSGSTSCATCPANTYADPLTDGCLACPVNSTSVQGSDMNGCVCNGGQRTYYKSRGSGGSMSYVLNEDLGLVFMQHVFTGSTPWMLDMFLPTTVQINCDGIPDPSANIVWTRGLRDASLVFSCTQNLTVTYQVDGPFSLNVSTTYFKCETCNTGFYSYKGVDSCMACPVGKFQDTPGSAGIESCRSCGPGRVTPSQGASQCVTCQRGDYQATLTACLQCQPGTYALEGQTSCSACPRDYWSYAGSFQCQLCPPHSNSSNGSALSGCLCLPGYHHVGLINSSGEIDTGNFTCEGCRAGYYSGSNFSSCLPCGTGFYSDTLAEACHPCASGTYQPLLVGANASSCLACPSGSNANQASADCVSCPPSYYCTGAGLQEPCPLGSYSPDSGLQNASECPLCPANSFCVDTLTLEYCPANTYSIPGTTTKLQCLCDPGYTCTYKKAIKAVVTLPLTEAQFELVRDEFLQAVADAAGVTVDKVAIINIRPRPVAARRRLLSLAGNPRGDKRHTTGDVRVHLHIKEAHTIETLDRHLVKRGMPKSSEVNVRHKHRLLVARTRILQYI